MKIAKVIRQFIAVMIAIVCCFSMAPVKNIEAKDVIVNTLKVRCLASMSKKSYSGTMYLYNADNTKVTEKKKMKIKGVGYYIDGNGKQKSESHTYGPENGTGLAMVVPAPSGYNYISGNVKFYITDMNTPIEKINLNPQ